MHATSCKRCSVKLYQQNSSHDICYNTAGQTFLLISPNWNKFIFQDKAPVFLMLYRLGYAAVSVGNIA